MKKIKILIDIILFIGTLLLMSTKITGVIAHEFLGITVGIVFIAHILINFKWLKNISKNYIKINLKTKIQYILDIILIIIYFITILMGILISKSIFNFNISNYEVISNIHNIFGILSLTMILLHLVFHLNSIFTKINNKLNIDNNILRVVEYLIYSILSFILLGIVINGIYGNNNETADSISDNANSNNTNNKTTNTSNNSVNNNQDTIEKYLGKLHCTGCGRHCLLTNPQCGKGISQQQQMVKEYNEEYNTNASYTSNKF